MLIHCSLSAHYYITITDQYITICLYSFLFTSHVHLIDDNIRLIIWYNDDDDIDNDAHALMIG